jgi:hypothetical protein
MMPKIHKLQDHEITVILQKHSLARQENTNSLPATIMEVLTRQRFFTSPQQGDIQEVCIEEIRMRVHDNTAQRTQARSV